MSASSDPSSFPEPFDPPQEFVARPEKERGASPIDVHVGTRIRQRRLLMGMSQERLGEALGLTFQQVQKYERGANRVGASRLFDLSRVLDVPISFFFDDMAGQQYPGEASTPPNGNGRPAGLMDRQDGLAPDHMSSRETVELVRAFHSITDPAVRKRVFELIKSLVPDTKA